MTRAPLDFCGSVPDDQAWAANDRELVSDVIERDGATTSASLKAHGGSTAVTRDVRPSDGPWRR